MSYLDECSRALGAVGITGRLRARILVELEDHLACDPGAELGAPRQLACRFADELGTSRARRAAIASFAALALAGGLFTATFLTAPAGALVGRGHAASPFLGDLGNLMAILFPQLAFVAGVLAGLRAYRRRGRPVLAGAEAAMIVRRAAVGVAAGPATMIGLALIGIEYRGDLSSSWLTLNLLAAIVGGCSLAAVVPSLVAAVRVRSTAPGTAGNVFDDLGDLAPRWLCGRPWRFAYVVSGGLVVLVTLLGIAQSDGYDGAARGLAEAVACLIGFATLGRFLGLRGARGDDSPADA